MYSAVFIYELFRVIPLRRFYYEKQRVTLSWQEYQTMVDERSYKGAVYNYLRDIVACTLIAALVIPWRQVLALVVQATIIVNN